MIQSVKRKVKRAFTLIEVLVAVSILSLMMLMIAQIFDMFSRTYNSATSTMQTFDDVRAILFSIRKDVIGAMVRTNDNRELGFAVRDGSGTTLPEIGADDIDDTTGKAADLGLIFAVPDEKVGTLDTMSFVTHYAYLWQKETGVLYRATYDTAVYSNILQDPSVASSAQGSSETANVSRLRNITLSYQNPENWIASPEFSAAITDAEDLPILRNVFTLEIRCHEDSSGTNYTTNWPVTEWRLPHYVELIMGIARDQDRELFLRQIAVDGDITDTNRLQRFVLTVPMINRGVISNQVY